MTSVFVWLVVVAFFRICFCFVIFFFLANVWGTDIIQMSDVVVYISFFFHLRT